MARIAGVDIPREKRLEISLTYIFGDRPHRRRRSLRRARASTPTPACVTSPTKRSTAIRDLRRRQPQGRGRPAPRHRPGHQAQDRDRLLPGHPPPHGPAGARPAHPHQRPHPQGPEEDRRRQEEGAEVDGQAQAGWPPPPPPRAQERHLRRGPHQELVQQHDRLHHRPRGQRPRVGVGRQRRVQGLAQVHAVRRPDGRRAVRPRGPWSTACARSTSW